MITLYLLIGCVFFSILLLFVFWSKKRISSVENKIFISFAIFNFFGLLLEICLQLIAYFCSDNDFLGDFVGRCFLVYIVVSLAILSVYTFVITKDDFKSLKKVKQKQYLNKIVLIHVIVVSIICVISCLLPMEKYINGNIMYTYGPAVQIIQVSGFVFVMIWIILIIRNYKNIKNKQNIPIIAAILLLFIFAYIQTAHPELLFFTAMETFISYLLFFTIENPDLQLIEELYKNKKLIEKSNQDTSNFLFRMTQDIKKPVKDIIEISQRLQNTTDVKEFQEGITFICNTGKDLDYLINDALDVSNMTTKKLKIFDNRYNSFNLFKEIEYRFEKQVPASVKFHFSMSTVIPSYLYGDSIKLKQALNSVLEDALKHTSSGEINFDVSGIVKYGVCRLIITVSDTGEGISIEEVNNILSLNSEELVNIDLRNRDGDVLNLKEVKKLVSLLGGNLMVKSEEKIGTTVSIVLEQKVVESKETEISKKLESYEQSLYRNKKVMVVDDDAKELAKITTFLENHDAEVNGSLFGRDVIEKIASNIKYDLIILDDETSTYSALDVLNELKKNKKFNTPVVVMINDNKEFIKLHYLQDGFADCIMKSKLESEVDRIMKRF